MLMFQIMENLLYRSKYINDKCFFPRIRILSAQRTDSDRQQRLHWDEDADDKLTSYYCTILPMLRFVD